MHYQFIITSDNFAVLMWNIWL